jgi:uncharacterized protein
LRGCEQYRQRANLDAKAFRSGIIKSLAIGDKRKVDTPLYVHYDLPGPMEKTVSDLSLGKSLSDAETVMTNGPQFVADAMLGKLAKWLRVMGIDVLYDPDLTDAWLLRCAELGGKIILTRDHRLIHRRGPTQRFYIESDYYHEQVRQVVQAFRLTDRIQVFTRCLCCNAPLGVIAKQLVSTKVPPYINATQVVFKHCVSCGRLYWGGTHRDNMLRQLQAILDGLHIINSEMHR